MYSLYYSYSQFIVYDGDDLGDFPWTDIHIAQGFIRRDSEVSIRTLTEYGCASIELFLNAYDGDQNFDRLLKCPFYAKSGHVFVISPDQTDDDSPMLVVDPGHYSLVVGQKFISDLDDDPEAEFNEFIKVYGGSV